MIDPSNPKKTPAYAGVFVFCGLLRLNLAPLVMTDSLHSGIGATEIKVFRIEVGTEPVGDSPFLLVCQDFTDHYFHPCIAMSQSTTRAGLEHPSVLVPFRFGRYSR